jgi:hypothetical protein
MGEAELLSALRHLPGMRRCRELNAEVQAPLRDCVPLTTGGGISFVICGRDAW